MSGINAGDLDREITLITGVKTQDSGTGEEVITWDATDAEAARVVWAQWLPAGTREQWQAQQRLNAYVDGVLRLYDISPRPTPDGTRIRFQSRDFDVKGVVEVGRSEGLELAVTARADGNS